MKHRSGLIVLTCLSAGHLKAVSHVKMFESRVFQTARWSALLLGVFYGKQRFEYLKPIAEEERRVEEAEKKAREEQERIYKQLSEGNTGPHPH
ncbi:ATP synthase subunit e, partial [Nibea albiflora]